MKPLSCISIIALASILVAICGCDKENVSGNGNGHKYSDAEINKALGIIKTLRIMHGDTKKDYGINTQIAALEQGTFPGAVGKEGAIVTFDEQDNPIRGITTRIFDRETGAHCEVRDLTPAELMEAAEALRAHYHTAVNAEDRQAIKTIFVFSESFRMAVCESVLNVQKDRDYFMSSDIHTKSAGIYVDQAGAKTLIAEDKIYYSSKD